MLNLLKLNTPIIVNGVQYPNSQVAYETLKGSKEEITIVIPNGKIQPQKNKSALLAKYAEMTGEEAPPEVVEKVEELENKLYRIKVKKWMTEKSSPGFDFMQKWNNDIPMPLVIMKGKVLEETKGMIKMELHATPEPSSHCFRCGRALSHPVSILYGIGPECGGHFHINPLSSQAELDAKMDEIKAAMKELKWVGWIVKSSLKEMKEIAEDEVGYKGA